MFALTPLETLALLGLIGALTFLIYIISAQSDNGSPTLAAALSAGFATYSGVTIAQEGILPVWINHTTNMWGVQVWWDLLFAVAIAFFFIATRARKHGMQIWLWGLFVAATASIGLLAMCARLFWLENAAATKQAESAKPAKPAS